MSKRKHADRPLLEQPLHTPLHTLIPLDSKGIEHIQDLLDSVDQAVAALTETADEGLHKLRKQLRRRAKRTRVSLQRLGVDPARVGHAVQAAGGYVRRHPWQAAGVLVAAGVVTALAVSAGTDAAQRH